jgi:hypothetical protein
MSNDVTRIRLKLSHPFWHTPRCRDREEAADRKRAGGPGGKNLGLNGAAERRELFLAPSWRRPFMANNRSRRRARKW